MSPWLSLIRDTIGGCPHCLLWNKSGGTTGAIYRRSRRSVTMRCAFCGLQWTVTAHMLSKATQQWLERATDKERPFMEDAAFIFGGGLPPLLTRVAANASTALPLTSSVSLVPPPRVVAELPRLDRAGVVPAPLRQCGKHAAGTQDSHPTVRATPCVRRRIWRSSVEP
jgi:hypothetical protein